VVQKIYNRTCRVPGHSSQCSRVCGASPHLGQFGSTELSVKVFIRLKMDTVTRSHPTSKVASFLETLLLLLTILLLMVVVAVVVVVVVVVVAVP